MWSLRKSKLSLVHFCLSVSTFGRHLYPNSSPHKTLPTQPPSWTYPCSPLNACCREFHCNTESPLTSVPAQHRRELGGFLAPFVSLALPCALALLCSSISLCNLCILITCIRFVLCLQPNVTLFCIRHLQRILHSHHQLLHPSCLLALLSLWYTIQFIHLWTPGPGGHPLSPDCLSSWTSSLVTFYTSIHQISPLKKQKPLKF